MHPLMKHSSCPSCCPVAPPTRSSSSSLSTSSASSSFTFPSPSLTCFGLADPLLPPHPLPHVARAFSRLPPRFCILPYGFTPRSSPAFSLREPRRAAPRHAGLYSAPGRPCAGLWPVSGSVSEAGIICIPQGMLARFFQGSSSSAS